MKPGKTTIIMILMLTVLSTTALHAETLFDCLVGTSWLELIRNDGENYVLKQTPIKHFRGSSGEYPVKNTHKDLRLARR